MAVPPTGPRRDEPSKPTKEPIGKKGRQIESKGGRLSGALNSFLQSISSFITWVTGSQARFVKKQPLEMVTQIPFDKDQLTALTERLKQDFRLGKEDAKAFQEAMLKNKDGKLLNQIAYLTKHRSAKNREAIKTDDPAIVKVLDTLVPPENS